MRMYIKYIHKASGPADRILIDVKRAHGHAAVNQVIDACELTRRFGIRKVWPDNKGT